MTEKSLTDIKRKVYLSMCDSIELAKSSFRNPFLCLAIPTLLSFLENSLNTRLNGVRLQSYFFNGTGNQLISGKSPSKNKRLKLVLNPLQS